MVKLTITGLIRHSGQRLNEGMGNHKPKKKGASRPESALEAKSYICLDRKSIIGIFEIWL